MNVSDKILYKAFKFAVKAHRKQKRKGNGAPYIVHPVSALRWLYDTKVSKNMNLLAVCMLLHDVHEDCGISLEEIAKIFGHAVAAIVGELSNDPKQIAKFGKTEYLKAKMTTMSSYALVLKLCDRLDNVSDRGYYDDYMKSTEQILFYLRDSRKLSSTHIVLMKKISSYIFDSKQNDIN